MEDDEILEKIRKVEVFEDDDENLVNEKKFIKAVNKRDIDLNEIEDLLLY